MSVVQLPDPDRAFLDAFEAQRVPLEVWTHRAHVRLGWIYVRSFGVDGALSRLRRYIPLHNVANGIENSESSGYHDTITVAWLHLVSAMIDAWGPTTDSQTFCDAHPELMESRALRFFYSPGRLMTARARASYVPPDLAPLPRVR